MWGSCYEMLSSGSDPAKAARNSQQLWLPTQDQVRKNPGTDGVDHLQALPLREKLLGWGDNNNNYYFEAVAAARFPMLL